MFYVWWNIIFQMLLNSSICWNIFCIIEIHGFPLIYEVLVESNFYACNQSCVHKLQDYWIKNPVLNCWAIIRTSFLYSLCDMLPGKIHCWIIMSLLGDKFSFWKLINVFPCCEHLIYINHFCSPLETNFNIHFSMNSYCPVSIRKC